MSALNEEMFIGLFGSHLRQLRKSKEMTIQDVAGNSGMELRQIGRIERGEISTKVWTAKRYADAIGVSLSELFDFEIPDESPD